MKLPIFTVQNATVNPVSTLVWQGRNLDFNSAAIFVTNTGLEPVQAHVETRLRDTGPYARRPIYDLVDLLPGESRQFDADITASYWVALVCTASGAGSTVTADIALGKDFR